jgi:hypothetical protein
LARRSLCSSSGAAEHRVERGAMPSNAAKYIGYARECTRLAKNAKSEEQRRKLTELSGIWMQAAMTEEELAGPQLKLGVAH